MTFDLIILGILVFAMIRGAMKGIVWQLAAIAALVLCFAFAESASLVLAPAIAVKPPANRWIAMLIIYVALSFVSFGLARVLRTWIEKAKFVEFDRHLGALFGLLKGVVFSLVLIFFVVTLSESYRKTLMNSYSGYAAAIIMDRLHPVMPDGLHDVLEPYIHSLDRPDMDLKHSHHDHDHHGHEAHNPFEPGENPFDAGANPDGKPAFEIPPFFDELVNRLPSLSMPAESGSEPFGAASESSETADLRALLTEALRNTAIEHQDELKQLLLQAGRDRLRDVAGSWRYGKPGAASQRPAGAFPEAANSTPFDSSGSDLPFFGEGDDRAPGLPTGAATTSSRARQTEILKEISELFSDSATARAGIIEEIQSSLAGLPDQVVLTVLEDWRADLLDIKPDPLPETTVLTQLDARIVAHLARARVPLSSLSSSLQSRLRDVQRQ